MSEGWDDGYTSFDSECNDRGIQQQQLEEYEMWLDETWIDRLINWFRGIL